MSERGHGSSQTRQREPRTRISLRVRYRSPGDEAFREDRTTDVSSQGMFIATADPPPRATLLKLQCVTRENREPVVAVARVAWRRCESTEERPAGMGVKLVRIDARSSRALSHALRSARTATGAQTAAETPPAAPPRPVEDAAQKTD
ncbi:MAG: PilZ domain-containing protein, partial [Myxococcales bacterium]